MLMTSLTWSQGWFRSSSALISPVGRLPTEWSSCRTNTDLLALSSGGIEGSRLILFRDLMDAGVRSLSMYSCLSVYTLRPLWVSLILLRGVSISLHVTLKIYSCVVGVEGLILRNNILKFFLGLFGWEKRVGPEGPQC